MAMRLAAPDIFQNSAELGKSTATLHSFKPLLLRGTQVANDRDPGPSMKELRHGSKCRVPKSGVHSMAHRDGDDLSGDAINIAFHLELCY